MYISNLHIDFENYAKRIFKQNNVDFVDPYSTSVNTERDRKKKRFLKIFSSSGTTRILLRQLLNLNHRIIQERKWKVQFSSVLQEKSDHSLFHIVNQITEEARKGQNLTKYLSKDVLRPYIEDELFNNWGLYHLHLSDTQEYENSIFNKRSDWLLFIYQDKNTLYFLDIIKHNTPVTHLASKKTLNLSFCQSKIVKTLIDEFPEVKLMTLNGIRPGDELTDLEYLISRKKGMITSFSYKGTVYIPRMGHTSAKTSIELTQRSDGYIQMFNSWEDFLKMHYKVIAKTLGYRLDFEKPLLFYLDFDYHGMCVKERRTGKMFTQLTENYFFRQSRLLV